MRTIKFRGKIVKDSTCKHHNDWTYGDLNIVDERITIDNGMYYAEVKEETVGQFTGLLDCKGNEIYEGDILGLPETDSNGVQFRNRFARVVEWINDGFFLIDREERCGEVRKYGDRLALEISLKSKYAGIAKCLKEYGNYAVIGNVYDNPELIKD